MITGLPDAYGRGRIIGDYRRVALYGIDFLMKDKLNQFNSLQADLENGVDLEEVIRRREEINEQYKALNQMKEMAASYGYDISGPAKNAQEPSNGLTLPTLPPLNLKTAQRCPSAVYLHSWISTSNAT